MSAVDNSRAHERLPATEIALLWLGVAAIAGAIHWASLDQSFNSPDNVMRLVEVRAFLAGAPWFDPHEARIDPPLGYDTHWSRLIDGGLAGLIVLFRFMVAPDLAERLARCAWPLLLSGPAIAASAAAAVRLGGAMAGRATLLSALLGLIAMPGHFRPGEIDHHNAQIALSLVLVACALWGERVWLAAAAGVAGGLLLGVGLEATHVLLAVAAAFGLLAVFDHAWQAPARAFALALGFTTAAVYLLITPSALRFAPQCDALAVNSAAAVVTAAAGLAAVASFGARWSGAARLVALGAAGGAALMVFAAIEPRCLRGPFGLVDRAVLSLWLDNVAEVQSVAAVFRATGAPAVMQIGFPILAAASMVLVVRGGLRTPMAWALCAAFVLSAVIAVGTIRMMVYVVWLGLPFVGAAAAIVAARAARPTWVQAGAAVASSPPAVSLLLLALVSLAPAANNDSKPAALWAVDVSSCFRPEHYAAVAALPPGLVIAPLELGPSLLAHTGHRVVAVPYHRAGAAIRFNEGVMNDAAAEVETSVVARGADYVMTCRDFPHYARADSFFNALTDDTAGPWLEPLPLPPGNVLKIWKVKAP